MAKLDRFLEALLQRGARELTLCAGRPLSFVFDDGPRPASSTQLTSEQIRALLAELTESAELSALDEKGTIDRTFTRPGIVPMRLAAWLGADGIEARITPESSPATDPPGQPSAAPPERAAQARGAGAGERPIEELLRLMVERGASDLHLCSCEQPMLRVDGGMHRLEGWPVLEPTTVRAMLETITPAHNWSEYVETHDTDFAYEIAGLSRYRANLFVDRMGPGAVFRTIPTKILSVEDLGLSSQIVDLCRLTKGLVLVTGPTGAGKSTTLAALVDYINRNRNDHIITIEDPIEFVHENRRCLLNQREVHNHTTGFKRALRAALREDPDIVLVGEMRDLETIAIAIETAETGHLVFGTLHTTTAVSTVDRIIDQFPPDRQPQIRVMLSESLKGVVSQTLCRKIGGGRVAALEVLIGIPSVANLIREGKTFQIPSIMQTGRKHGMITLNESLMELVRAKKVEPEEAYRRAVDKLGIRTQLKSAGIRLDASATDREAAGVGA
ncbi:MAG: type IV pilus twitching motility protein PilT [Acidobacteriota bacterium]|nr:MAG: type IV pilus twitching motility protein PilT [Acidobacteriota bacterium]